MKFQFPEDLHRLLYRTAQHLFPATIVGPDGCLVLGILPDKVFGSFLQTPAGILLFIPIPGADRREEPAPFLFIRDDLVIEIFRVPVHQHPAEIEYQCIYVRVSHTIFIKRSTAFSSVSSF